MTVFTHMRPDGDAFGSLLALTYALRKLGIEAEACNESDLPSNLDFLDGVKEIKKTPALDADAFVALDCADENRLGGLAEKFRLFGTEGYLPVKISEHALCRLQLFADLFGELYERSPAHRSHGCAV